MSCCLSTHLPVSVLYHVPESSMLPMHAQLTNVFDLAVATVETVKSDMYNDKIECDVLLPTDRSSRSQLQVLLSLSISNVNWYSYSGLHVCKFTC